jgi:hypothetical protein
MFSISSRRFGGELEYNAFDGESRSKADNELPAGIYEIANILSKGINENVDVNKWGYTTNNYRWVLKPDSSCGIEVCSPPYRGELGCDKFQNGLQSILNCKSIASDHRCSMHVHIEIEDFNMSEIAHMIQKWVNFEPFFFFMTNPMRWINQYCMPIGFSHQFDFDEPIKLGTMLDKLSEYKYYVINFYHYQKNRRKTIEFRCMGSEACLNIDDAVNWIKILICFVDRCKGINILDPIQMEYKSCIECIKFLNVNEYFLDSSISMWIVSKLNHVLNCDLSAFFQWESLVKFSKEDILSTIEYLEKGLK